MTWLVTGGAGYIGAHVVRAFGERGLGVAVVDDLSSGHRDFVPPGVTFVEGDILDTGLLTRTMQEHGVVGVVHVVVAAPVAHRHHAVGPRPDDVGAAEVADVGGPGGFDAQAVEGVGEDRGVGLVGTDLVGERPVVEQVEHAVVLQVRPQDGGRAEADVADDADAQPEALEVVQIDGLFDVVL